MEDGKQIASVAGYVTQVNRLVTVTPLRQLYQGEQQAQLVVTSIISYYLAGYPISHWQSLVNDLT